MRNIQCCSSYDSFSPSNQTDAAVEENSMRRRRRACPARRIRRQSSCSSLLLAGEETTESSHTMTNEWMEEEEEPTLTRATTEKRRKPHFSVQEREHRRVTSSYERRQLFFATSASSSSLANMALVFALLCCCTTLVAHMPTPTASASWPLGFVGVNAYQSTGVPLLQPQRMHQTGTGISLDIFQSKQSVSKDWVPTANQMIIMNNNLWTMQLPSSPSSSSSSSSSMFLSPSLRSKLSIPTSAASTTSAITRTVRIRGDDSTTNNNWFHRSLDSTQTKTTSRGTLGFQLHPYCDDDSRSPLLRDANRIRSSSTVSLHGKMATTTSRGMVVSNIDAVAWNLPEQAFSSNRERSAGSTTTTVDNDEDGSTHKRHTENDLTTAAAPTSIPWIPSSPVIESLTVVQLKEALKVRALKKTGNKYELQERIKEWCSDQRRRQQLLDRDTVHSRDLSELSLRTAYGTMTTTMAKSHPDRRPLHSPPLPPRPEPQSLEAEILSWGIDSSALLSPSPKPKRTMNETSDRYGSTERLNVDSLAEWARTVDLEPLLHRREAIHREKLTGKVPQKKMTSSSSLNVIQPSEYLTVLKKMFDRPSSPYSNREVKQMYAAAKHADQVGDRELSKRILLELKTATPNDARIFRRLARMEQEDGNATASRVILNEGLDLHPENGFLWHGLGQLEGSINDRVSQNKHWEKAIAVDPSLPHSYHALGTYEHTQGRVANAMRILKQGVEYCPMNHRLHHALGDLYRDAKMLNMATSSYLKAIKHGPTVSHGFAYTSLAYVAYEEGQVDQCRVWLHKAVRVNNGRHANGWIALAQLEESEGDIDAARSACIAGIGQYERGLLQHCRNFNVWEDNDTDERIFLEDPVALKNRLLKAVPSYRSGDRFFNVYRNWLRLEERYGTIDTVEEVYERASVAFRREWKIALDAAQYFSKLNVHGRAMAHFAQACKRVGTAHADPYRLFAEFEMSRGNFIEARKILYSGAMILAKSKSGGSTDHRGLTELFLTWAVCEWHLDNYLHAEKLFKHSLELAAAVETDPKLLSFVLYTMSRFEHFRGENRRAQHFIGLCLKENKMPGGNSIIWDLWAAIAHEMGDSRLAFQCQQNAASCQTLEQGGNGDPSGFSDMLRSGVKGHDMHQMMRRDPWRQKIFGNMGNVKRYLSLALLPDSRQLSTQR